LTRPDVHYVKPADRYARVAEQKVSRETGAKKLALFLKPPCGYAWLLAKLTLYL